MATLLVLAGLVLLVWGGDFLVKGATGLALNLNIPPMLVGMTVVALGTSAPELVVTFRAALIGKPDIAIGNVVGSNIANVALILGLTVLIFPIAIKKTSLRFDWVMMMLASFAFYLCALDGEISRLEGVFFIAALVGFIMLGVRRARKNRQEGKTDTVDQELLGVKQKKYSLFRIILFVIVGIVGLVFGARLLLDGAETIARHFGVSDRVIAISLVAFGTSLPELAASVIAAFKKQEDISLGNIIGSNLFNILAILGVTSLIQPIHVSSEIMQSDIYWMLGTSAAILPLSIRRLRLGRVDGIILMSSYIVFMYFLLT